MKKKEKKNKIQSGSYCPDFMQLGIKEFDWIQFIQHILFFLTFLLLFFIMNQLDPFIIYTVKLVTEKKAYVSDRSKEHHRLFPTTIGRIMTIKSWSNTHCNKPKLNKDNLLSLLYHAGKYTFIVNTI